MWRSTIAVITVPYLFTVALLPLLVLPFAWTPPYLQKGILTAFILGVSVCAAAFSLVRYRSSIEVPRSLLAYAAVPLFIVACLSLIVNSSLPVSFSGLGFEAGSLGSFFLFLVASFTGALIPRSFVYPFFYALVVSAGIASALSAVLILMRPDAVGVATLSGAWPDLTYIIAAALLVSTICTDSAQRLRPRLMYAGVSVVLLVLFVLFFEITAATVLLIILAASGLFVAVGAIAHAGTRIPFAILAASVCVLICMLVGVRSPVLKVAPVNGYPSFVSTVLVGGALYIQNLPGALIGTGPGSFTATWERYRLMETNSSPSAGLVPDSAYSTVATIAVTLGLIGLLSFILIPLLLVASVTSFLVRDSSISQSAGQELPAALALALFSFGAMFVYPIALPLFLVAGAATGVVASLLVRERPVLRLHGDLRVTVPLAVLFVAGGLFLIQTSFRQFLAAELHARGNAISTESSESRTTVLMFAARVWNSGTYDIDASRALFQQANAQARQSPVDVEAVKKSLREAADFASLATQVARSDYRTWLYSASLYVTILSTGYPNAEESANVAISQVQQLAPMRAEGPFLEAQMAVQKGDAVKARDALRRALILNPDYTDAKNLLNSITSQQTPPTPETQESTAGGV
ncbi:hypothetical protein K8R03_02725 [Candidatus Kaiserbacteria bacterium]|nr:hypothetical protein [Candidatus Kaiserbacteria bacterium]